MFSNRVKIQSINWLIKMCTKGKDPTSIMSKNCKPVSHHFDFEIPVSNEMWKNHKQCSNLRQWPPAVSIFYALWDCVGEGTSLGVLI